jgi:hypothetical protein
MRPFVQLATVLSGSQHLLESRWSNRSHGSSDPDGEGQAEGQARSACSEPRIGARQAALDGVPRDDRACSLRAAADGEQRS